MVLRKSWKKRGMRDYSPRLWLRRRRRRTLSRMVLVTGKLARQVQDSTSVEVFETIPRDDAQVEWRLDKMYSPWSESVWNCIDQNRRLNKCTRYPDFPSALQTYQCSRIHSCLHLAPSG